jgi:fluoride exporter
VGAVTLVFVLAGAAVGGPLRYLIDREVQARSRSVLPLGTLVVNLSATLMLGVLLGAGGVGVQTTALLDTGFCGSLSTYSTFSYESVRVAEDDGLTAAMIYAGATLIGGLLVATLGFLVGRQFA